MTDKHMPSDADMAEMLRPRGLVNEGGPAYPQPHWPTDEWDADDDGSAMGMSVRDRIAIAALQGMLSHATRYRPRPDAPARWHDAIAQEAFQIADAMLEARKIRHD